MSVFDLLRDAVCDGWPVREWRVTLCRSQVATILQFRDGGAALCVRGEPVRHCPSAADACLYIRKRFLPIDPDIHRGLPHPAAAAWELRQ